MFKWFTWAKFLGTVTSVLSIAAGLGGQVGAKAAAIGTFVGGVVHAVSSLITTWKSGTATDASGKPVSGN